VISNSQAPLMTIYTVSGGEGGGVFNAGVLTIDQSQITGNTGALGGRMCNFGVLTINQSQFAGNTAHMGGGLSQGLYTPMTVITNSSFSSNVAQLGSGINNDANMLIVNSTITDNLGPQGTSGGGIDDTLPGGATANTLLKIVNCTIVGNSGNDLYNWPIANPTSVVRVADTIMGNVSGTIESQGHNLISNASWGMGFVASDLLNVNPLLGPLQDNGGPTLTEALLPGSPAIDAGSNSISGLTVPTTDQRGALRGPAGLHAGSTVDIGAYEASSSYLVTSTTDSYDVGTLRAAVGWANVSTNANPANLASPAANTVLFDTSGLFATPQTITLAPSLGTLELSNTSTAEAINGPTAGVTVSGGNAIRVFQVDHGVTASLSGLTITGGLTTGIGGGLDDQGSVTLANCTVAGNSAATGGGVGVVAGAAASLIDCTLSGNIASGNGGGLYNQGITTLINCTIAGNSANNGAGVYNMAGTTSLYDCTVSGNTAAVSGGGLDNGGGTTTLGNTIVAGNSAGTSGPDVFGTFDSLGHNLVGETDGSSGWVSSDLTGTIAHPLDAQLAPLAWYGGPTETMALLEGSLAIDAGSNGLIPPGVSTDQRGFPRIVGGTVDIGAFEFVPPSSALVVNSTADGPSPPGTLDLRAAVDLANVLSGAGTITFDPTVFATNQTITLSDGPLELASTSGLEAIMGPKTGVTVSGGGLSRVFEVSSMVMAAVSGLTITGGSTTGDGGGVYNEGGTTTLTNCTVSGNSASGRGGGVFNKKRGTITVINCNVSGNSAGAGGGVYNDDGTATLTDTTISGNSAIGRGGALSSGKRGTITVINCTLSRNFAGVGGGGIYNLGTASLEACTIAGNAAPVGGGIDNEPGGSATLIDTIVAANTGTGGAPSDIGGGNAMGVTGTYNLVGIGGAGGIAGGTGDIVLTDLSGLGLAPLGNYGGTSETMPLLPGSAAIDTGTTIPGISTDQRGLPIVSKIPDIGAFQSQGFVLSPVAGSTPQAVVTGAEFPNPLALIVTALNPIEPVAGGVVSYTVNPAANGASAGLSAATTIIGSSGTVQVTATANSIAGAYTVTATDINAASPATFNLTNLISLSFSGVVSQTISLGTASVTFAGTLANGMQSPSGESVVVTLNGATQQAEVRSSGAFVATFDASGLAASTTPYSVGYVYTSDGIFGGASTTSALTKSGEKATPTISWPNPADITYGTTLGAAQLDATASPPGTFTYNPPPGTILPAGSGQLLSVTFTPTDTTDENTATLSVTIDVARATPTITWANPADIVYGTPLSATQLDATSSWSLAGVAGSVAGTFVYTPAAGTLLGAGEGQVLSVAFTPADSADYNSASARATINVLPTADLAITSFAASPGTVQIGDDLTYTIVVTNNGPYPATAVQITSPLSAGANYVAGSGTVSPSGSVGLEGSSVVASVGALAKGATATVTFTVIPSLVGTLSATASVTASEIDLNLGNNSASTSTNVVDRVGTFEFSAAGFSVPENAGSAAVTMSRVNGARGTVTIHYATVAVDALAGVDFTPVAGTLTFPGGVTSETIAVPVLDDPYDHRDRLVNVVLSNVQTTETLGQAMLGTTSTAALTIRDTDPNFTPLIVNIVQWTGTASAITQILVTFNKPLITSTALDPANYALVNVGADGKYGTRDDSVVAMSVAMYQSSSTIVALTPAQALPANRYFHLSINGAASGGVEDVGENMLAGDGTTAGTSYSALLARGTSLKYLTPAGDLVSLRITGGGFLDDLLTSDGQGIELTVVGEVPHRTVLSGSVKKAKGSSGWVYLGDTIRGLGRFGDVRVKLPSPPFRVSRYPFSRPAASSTAITPLIAVSKPGAKTSVSEAAPLGPAARTSSGGVTQAMSRPFRAFRHRSRRT
jgi:uncharacterized repeat protein (TIGR01451 family)